MLNYSSSHQELMYSDEYFMRMAMQEAEMAFKKEEVPVGAVIVIENKIIAKAHNLTQLLKDVTAHAEMQAFTAASAFLGGKYMNECTLYVTLEPCVMCAGAAYWAQIKKIVYGASDTKRGYLTLGKAVLRPSTEVVRGVLAEDAAILLKRFFQERRDLV